MLLKHQKFLARMEDSLLNAMHHHREIENRRGAVLVKEASEKELYKKRVVPLNWFKPSSKIFY